MSTLTFDFETNTFAKGNPFSRKGKAVCLSLKFQDTSSRCEFIEDTQDSLLSFEGIDLLIGFNLKFDLHWARRVGISFEGCKVWCCQLAEFLLEYQQSPYPSLEATAVKYGLGNKLDVVKLEYWDKAVDTQDVPRDVLSEYANQDVELTYKVYLEQLRQFQEKPALFRLFKQQCTDLLILAEMEWNGLKYDVELCEAKRKEAEAEIEVLKQQLLGVYSDVPINLGSGDHLSAFLYGGTIVETIKEPDGFFKSGIKKGQIKYKNVEKQHVLPQMCKPIAKSELKKEGYYATDVKTLTKLKGAFARKYVPLLLRLSELDKLVGTYYKGLQEINKEMDWKPGMLHGQYNQCVTSTGRLSSSKPNSQNMAGNVKEILITRYLDI
jgi:DNA polymerase-1